VAASEAELQHTTGGYEARMAFHGRAANLGISLQVSSTDRWCVSKCSVCASPDTPIATPSGERHIADLRVGDLVYTIEGDAIRAVAIGQLFRGGHTDRDHAQVRDLGPSSPGAPACLAILGSGSV
jgi:hypothetical protein